MKRFFKYAGITVVVVLVMGVLIGIGYDADEGARPRPGADTCRDGRRDFLTAQTVPGATYVPCLTEEAGGWTLESESYENGGAQLHLTTDKVQEVAWDIRFSASCQPGTDRKVDKEGNPTTVYERTEDLADVDTGDIGIVRTEWMTFIGGCVVSTVTVPGKLDQALVLGDTDRLLAIVSRDVLAADVHDQTDGELTLDPKG